MLQPQVSLESTPFDQLGDTARGTHVFWWRKRNEGFEWRDYVRTTILVRREQRRQRLKDAQDAAIHQVKDAGRRGVEASVEGARVAGRGTWFYLSTGVSALGRGLLRGARFLGTALAAAAGGVFAMASGVSGRIGAPLGTWLEPVLSVVRQPRIGLALKIVTGLAALGAFYRGYSFGVDADVYVAGAVAVTGLLLMILAALTDPDRADSPRWGSRVAGRDSLLSRLKGGEFALPERVGFSPSTFGVAALALAGVVGVAGATFYYGLPSFSFFGSGSSSPEPRVAATGDPSKLEGRAVAVSGDRLRIDGKLVTLDGIEAPEASQACQRKTSVWRCGAAAKDALSSLVRGRRVSCDLYDENGDEIRARCYVRGADIAEALVRNGHVFSSGGFLSRYASLESEAQDAQLGLWNGAVERPQDYRDKRWAEAKKAAPDGCPIKGRIRSGARVYVLPWSPAYDSIRLSTARGERWFCSESEAQAAGWTKSSAS